LGRAAFNHWPHSRPKHLNEFLRPGHSGRIESNGTSHPELPWNALWRSDVREAIVETSGCVRPTTARPPERQRDIDHVRRITTKPPMRNNTPNARGLCAICGEPVPFYRDCHPACAQKAIRDELKRHWDLVKAEQASGAREVIGATIFAHGSVRPSRGHLTERVQLSTLCWVYHRQVTHWALLPPMPTHRVHKLVIHTHDGAALTTWKQVSFYGSKNEVEQSIGELMRRVPWILFGFGPDARAAMAPGRRRDTTREIEARRSSMATPAPTNAPRDDAAAAALEFERVNAFGVRGDD